MRVKDLRIIKSAQMEELISSVNYENVDIIFLNCLKINAISS
jgi:hypothetical protein